MIRCPACAVLAQHAWLDARDASLDIKDASRDAKYALVGAQ